MTSTCRSESPRLAARSIPEGIALAHRAAYQAPFVWVALQHPRAIRGTRAHREVADAGHSFLVWRCDDDGLVLQTDPFGLLPAFLYRRDSDVAVSTSIPKLIAEGATVTLDEAALAVFLRLGFFVGDDTPFKEIRAVPAGVTRVSRSGHVHVSGGPYLVDEIAVTRADAMDRAIGLTSRAVAKRRSSAPFALPLSGGRDSRHILLCLVDSGCYPEFVVTVPRFPPAAPEDERIAALVAASLHLRHVLVPQTSDRATAEARKNITTSYCADEHAWFYAMLDVLSERAAVVYEGIGGSLWTIGWLADRSSRDLWQAGRTREVASRLLERYQIIGEACLTDVLPAARFSRDIAIERLSRELDRHVGAPDPGKSFHFWNRLRRELALIPFGEMHQRGEVLTPLVDRELVDFLLALAPQVVSSSLSRSDKSFHSDALQRAFPAAADLPFERPDAPRIDAGAHDRALTRSVALYLVNRRKPLRLMRTACAVPRIVYTMLNRRYAASTRWLATTALYLSQLEDAAS